MTIGAYNFVFVILKVAFVEALITGLVGLSPCAGTAACVIISVKTEFLDQVKFTDTSQLINGKSNVFQKLLRSFNGTANSTSLVSPLASVFPAILNLLWDLYHNYQQEDYLAQLCNNSTKNQMSLSNFCYTQADHTLALQNLNLLHCLLMHDLFLKCKK